MTAHGNERAVRVRGLRRRYGGVTPVTPVDGIDLGIRRGEGSACSDPAAGTRAGRSRVGIARQDESAPAELTVR
ncbi:hypothetical protein [Streptomyces sp. Ag109_O5-10]|uniref:hypothetical protein n=1 Tax=Streptomyces sp. Ag109_O5-10 TaxID=1855349 RepID=UPI00115FCC97